MFSALYGNLSANFLQTERWLIRATFQAFFAGFLWAYFSFYQTPGFFVHQWNVRVRDMIHVQYVSAS